MAFGLKNAPAFFQRMMQRELRGFGHCSLIYIDDVVIWGDSPEECLENVEAIIRRLKDAGITCNGAKCCFLSKEIELLGHRVKEGKLLP